MARLEIKAPTGERSYEIAEEFITIGGAAGNHVRLRDPEVAPVHLRLIHGRAGYRIEIADEGLEVAVNGEACSKHALADHDRIEIGGTVLTFVDERDQPAAVAKPAPAGDDDEPEPIPVHPHHARDGHHRHGDAAHRPHHARHGQHGHHGEHGHHHYHPKKQASWQVWVYSAAGAGLLIFLLMQLFGAGSYYRDEGSPDHWLQQAKAENEKGNLQRALDSLQLADLRGPDGATQQQIADLRTEIKKKIGVGNDQNLLNLSKVSLEVMTKFEQDYLMKSKSRPAAREIVRRAQAWLTSYSEVVKRYPERAADVGKVQSIVNRFQSDAQLDKPDDAGDVLFGVDMMTMGDKPLYMQALINLDDYVRNHDNDVRLTDLKVRRADLLAKARADFDGHGANARRLLAERRFTDAGKEVQEMRNAIVVQAWEREADAIDADIQRASK